MLALRAYAKDDPTRLVFEEAPRPDLRPEDALIRVVASGVTPSELSWPTTWLEPNGVPRRLPIIPGHELSGVVAELGPNATGLALGDEVYGLIDFQRDGADAEFVAARASDLAPKPAKLSHVESATAPLSALTAWQALFDHAQLQPGQRVLIHGAAGGVGSFAVQLAHWRGADVIATASAKHAELLRTLGADQVIDYQTTRFEDVVRQLDIVFDTVGGATWERSWGVIRPGGTLVSIAVPRPPVEERAIDGVRGVWFVVEPNRSTLTEIAALFDAGAITPIVA